MRSPASAAWAARGAAMKRAARVASFFTRPPLSSDWTTAEAAWPLLCRQLEHPLHRPQRAQAQVLGQRDLGLAVAQAEVELLQRVEPHVGADAAVAARAGRRRDQFRVGPRLRHQMKDAHFGGDDEASGRTALDVLEQA